MTFDQISQLVNQVVTQWVALGQLGQAIIYLTFGVILFLFFTAALFLIFRIAAILNTIPILADSIADRIRGYELTKYLEEHEPPIKRISIFPEKESKKEIAPLPEN